RLAELDHVAVGIADPELGPPEVAVGDAARVERLPYPLDALHLQRDVRIGRVDVLEYLLLLHEVELGAAQVVPRAGKAQIRPRRQAQAEQALVERARAREVGDADRGVIEAANVHVGHAAASRLSTRKVASGPIPNDDPIQAIQYLRARRSRMRASSTGSVTTLARPRTPPLACTLRRGAAPVLQIMIRMQKPRVHFARTRDGVSIAYSVAGQGHPILFLSGWVSHLEVEVTGESVVRFLDGLSGGGRRRV